MANYEEILAAEKKINDAQAQADIEAGYAAYDKAAAEVSKQYENQITKTQNSYTEQFRKNELAQIINEEKTKKRMSDLGLTDSGLNRTQQTAIQLQRANADYSTQQERQNAVDSIRNDLSLYRAEVEQQKAQYAIDTKAKYDAQAQTNATAKYNTQLENEAKIEAATIEAAAKRQEGINSGTILPTANDMNFNQFRTMLAGNTYQTPKQKSVAIENWVESVDTSDEEVHQLIDASGMSRDEFWKSLSPTTQQGYLEAGYTPYRADDYKTCGPADYEIVLNKQTYNGGGGIDNNDIVTIKYAFGTQETIVSNVRIDQLGSDYIKRTISNKTNGQKKDAKILVRVDLAGLKITQ